MTCLMREHLVHFRLNKTIIRWHGPVCECVQFRNMSIRKCRYRTRSVTCGLVVSAPAWDGTGCELDS